MLAKVCLLIYSLLQYCNINLLVGRGGGIDVYHHFKKKLELIEHELCINKSGEPLALNSMQISNQ